MRKVYKNDSNIAVSLIVLPIAISILLLFKNFLIEEVLGCDVFLIILIYLLSMPGCWDVYLEKDKLTFRNEWNLLWSNEWEFAFKDIVKIEIRKLAKEGPAIYVVAQSGKERFYSLGYERTMSLTEDLRKQGIEVDSQLEEKMRPA